MPELKKKEPKKSRRESRAFNLCSTNIFSQIFEKCRKCYTSIAKSHHWC